MSPLILLGIALGAPPAPPVEPHALTSVPIRSVELEDPFWSPKLETLRRVTLPDVLAKFEKDGALDNFDRIRDGKGGPHAGPPWYDGLIYETMRAACDFLGARPDPDLERRLDGYVSRIAAAAARDPHGYINTYTQIEEPDHRWGMNGGNDNWQHDCYNAGALVDAAVHRYVATGKTDLLVVAARLANHMCDVMGPPPRKNVVPGHSLAEEAFVKLHLLFRDTPGLKASMPFPVDERRYLELVEFWIENRGNHEGRKSFGSYGQDHEPVLRQATVEGHAVRATLLYTGLVAAGRVNGRRDYLEAALRLRENLVGRRMYITGGLGSTAAYEGFGPDWFLPNDGYVETCAAVGAGFFHHQLSLALGDGRHVDELERVLYNGVLCGVSLEGDSYFYENPLETRLGRERWAWHGCPCCPPMLLKILAALPGYVYALDADGIYLNLFVGSRTSIPFRGGTIGVRLETGYPWDGRLRIAVEPEAPREFELRVRMPGWCRGASFAVNGSALDAPRILRGYATLRRRWQPGDRVDVRLDLPAERMRACPAVQADVGRVALMRGPIVYCIEGLDQAQSVRAVSLPPDAPILVEHRPELLGGVTVLRARGLARAPLDPAPPLYLADGRPGSPSPLDVTAIPYFASANRGRSAMEVWIPESPSLAEFPPPDTIAGHARASASHCWTNDTIDALNDGIEPTRSDDGAIPRMTFWDRRGTKEWVQYDFGEAVRVSAVEVWWWDERRIGAHCRVPKAWRLLRKDGEAWTEVRGASPYGTEMDRPNRVTFEPLQTSSLRMEIELQEGWSAGILEWRVE